MAVSHVWTVTELVQKNDGSGIVCCVNFTLTSADDVTTTSLSQEDRVELEDPAPEDLIPYGDLTEAIVLGWVVDKLGSNVARLEAVNSGWIDATDNPPAAPTMVQANPW